MRRVGVALGTRTDAVHCRDCPWKSLNLGEPQCDLFGPRLNWADGDDRSDREYLIRCATCIDADLEAKVS
jgi:hypothetical protein